MCRAAVVKPGRRHLKAAVLQAGHRYLGQPAAPHDPTRQRCRLARPARQPAQLPGTHLHAVHAALQLAVHIAVHCHGARKLVQHACSGQMGTGAGARTRKMEVARSGGRQRTSGDNKEAQASTHHEGAGQHACMPPSRSQQPAQAWHTHARGSR